MAKFLNKKEQVIDFKLTPYAKYLLSIGRFKPAFYAFFDDNVLYDRKYTATGSTEGQNSIDNRIKDETQYLETYVHFKSIEANLSRNKDLSYSFYDTRTNTQTMTNVLPSERYTVDEAIGDAFLNGPAQNAPSWKILALSSYITSSAQSDPSNESLIPQVDIISEYKMKIVDYFVNDPGAVELSVRAVNGITQDFIDGKAIQLVESDPVIYAEEANTELLTENFDVEVFEVLDGNSAGELQKKYFKSTRSNIKNGFIVADKPVETLNLDQTTENVGYFFDVLFDSKADRKTVCKAIDDFDKSSYYIDLDFMCDESGAENTFFDIYGTVLEPEICAPPVEDDTCQD
jgi:hypothetical protein